MDRRAKLVAAGLLLSVFAAHAFVTPSPPPGFGGSPGAWTWTPPSAAQQVGQIMRGPGPMIPGGGTSSAAFRLGPGAARALAGGVVRGLIPGVGIALGVAWLAENCFEKQNGQWVRTCFPSGVPGPKPSTGTLYQPYAGAYSGEWVTVGEDACAVGISLMKSIPQQFGVVSITGAVLESCNPNAFALYQTSGTRMENGNVVPYSCTSSGCNVGRFGVNIRTKGDPCPVGWYSTPAGCLQTPPPQTVTTEQIEDAMAPKPLPQQLPPGVPYPLDPLAPSIWNPEPIAEPGVDPKSRPLRVPQGNPTPVPNTDPQLYRQPVTRWTHSPTQSEPWRMDVRPEDVTSPSPEGMQEPQPVTSGSPSGDKPEQFDLCKEHPDIIACQVFKPDELQPLPVPNKQVPLALNAEGGFPTGGSCPQPKQVQLMGQTFSFSMQPLCDFASGIKPLLIGFAWLSAALVFLGVARREG